MKTTLFAAVLFSTVAFAQGAAPAKAAPAKEEPKKDAAAAPAGGMDMSKMGPWSRKVKDEKAVKKEIDEFFKKEDEAMKAADMNAMLDRINFPVWMATDDSKGDVEVKAYDKAQYEQMMKPMAEGMKDWKMTHKPTVTVLSDSLAQVSDDFTMTKGKEKFTGKNGGLLAKVGGAWKWQMMVEAGWGGMGAGMADGKPSAGAPEKKDTAAAPAGSAAQKK